MIEPNKQYDVTVELAEFSKSLEKGTPGIHIKFVTPEGDAIHHTCWATEARKKMFAKEMLALGADAEVIGSREFWKTPGAFLQGNEATITTKIDYSRDPEGKVVVQWINASRPEVSDDEVGRLAAMFAEPAGEDNGR